MNRKSKPKTDDILPQEDRFMPTAPRRVFSLLPGFSATSKTKGKPISLPSVLHDPPVPRHKNKNKGPRPRNTGISIDRWDPSLVYDTDSPASSTKFVTKMKTSDESIHKRQQQAQIWNNSTRLSLAPSVAKSQTVTDFRSIPTPARNSDGLDSLKQVSPRAVNSNTKQETTVQQRKQTPTTHLDSRLNSASTRNFLLSKGINVDSKPQSNIKRNKNSDDDDHDIYHSASSSFSATEDTPRFILPTKTKRQKRSSKGTPISIPSSKNEEFSSISPSSVAHLSKERMKSNLDTKTLPAPVELSDEEMSDAIDTILFTYPLDRSKGSITISKEDRKRLEPGQFLNDSVIDFYLKWLMDSYSHRNQQDIKHTHIFSSFFYNRLTQGMGHGDQVKYENVRKWTTNIDLFENKYAIFPINEKWHWYLVLVCNIDKCIPKDPLHTYPSDSLARNRPVMFVLDSLGGSQKASMRHLTNYLRMEAATRRNVDPEDFVQPRLLSTDVPRQDNSCDCGVFLLHFVEKFLKFPQKFVDILLTEDSRHPLWEEHDIKDKRKELLVLFRKLHRMYKTQYK